METFCSSVHCRHIPAFQQASKQKENIFNRDRSLHRAESWTCRRAFDGAYLQIDFIMGDAYFNLKKAWQDHRIPIGNDHRCVHCILSRTEPYKQQYPRKHLLKGWKPFLDESGQPTAFQTLLEKKMRTGHAHLRYCRIFFDDNRC